MRAYDIILKKRNGEILTKDEIEYMIMGYVDGNIPDYQMAAFLMAIFFKHLNNEERANLTEIMAKSGDMLNLSKIEGKKVDKHSTGGVGDKTTLVVAPIVASLGIPVAKMSGRALGHTGGTIDKLESIPGFRTSLTLDEFFKNVNKYKIAVVGQTANLAPADKKIYALRDATATVDEVSLIASSIMSKKLAGGADAFVLDVKVGSGAFMKDIDSAKELATAMVEIAKSHKKEAVAVLTNMDEPLGTFAGNSLEVLEAINTLKGNGDKKFVELCLTLSAWMCYLAGKDSYEKCHKLAYDSLKHGNALEKFKEFVIAQGGDKNVIENPEKVLPISNKYIEFKAKNDGYISKINTEKVGIACNYLGAGRKKKEDNIDHSVGLEFFKKIGDKVSKGETIVKLYISENSAAEIALELLDEAYIISDEETKKLNIILDIVK
ncbi:thymidine phosphorylase [Thermosipho melanesiensis]|uniref:Pyrimidine-nucleoside phosphorylase n=2 Tax=Thermosipho melanesiensis TaxID=46541 RepID=A6LP24_THEM4|nr:pyrimidine-nucleoside phosphorylase [Thermosipho melanesiensis]ABR31675.1 pyrimidine-nucleoside phosphorylase [Thermosipho melanesiensis BI429]APT74702.1 thymidine phosphorylase [Thermosipho melanesiensis]OOC35199.1 thymidine phosphorylase [Thermosipho melanesiensis]OOC35409.1 thymidine phosphorylase [Thermosipho melanesiensis]OOC36660.1 thymidine phosphorylase [Thermosipho melanesiensis]